MDDDGHACNSVKARTRGARAYRATLIDVGERMLRIDSWRAIKSVSVSAQSVCAVRVIAVDIGNYLSETYFAFA